MGEILQEYEEKMKFPLNFGCNSLQLAVGNCIEGRVEKPQVSQKMIVLLFIDTWRLLRRGSFVL